MTAVCYLQEANVMIQRAHSEHQEKALLAKIARLESQPPRGGGHHREEPYGYDERPARRGDTPRLQWADRAAEGPSHRR